MVSDHIFASVGSNHILIFIKGTPIKELPDSDFEMVALFSDFLQPTKIILNIGAVPLQ